MSRLRKAVLEISQRLLPVRMRGFLLVQDLGAASGCHQKPERSFSCKGITLPVCARCTGVFVGQTAALLLFWLKAPFRYIHGGCLLGIMGVDWLLQEVKIKPSTNSRRFITGICGGLGLFILYREGIRSLGTWISHYFRKRSNP